MRRFKLILILLAAVVSATAQDHNYRLQGRLCDAETHMGIPEASLQLLRADSTVVETYRIETREDSTLFRFIGHYEFQVNEIGKYIVRASHVNYETVYMPVEIRLKRQHEVEVPEIRMKKVSQMLDEVVVKASKVKMVMRGDTIVFNADAFNLAEGSMLDALIAQLPGTELSQDGEITVNGKRIESLLIDGRSFFEGDPKAALQNLPAYTVNKVKVFDRKGKLTEMMGRNMNDKSYVMDVRLKKEYQRGWMGNFEVGGGTESHYKTKMMATMSTTKSRFSIIGNVNNLSDDDMNMMGVNVRMRAYSAPASGTTTYRKGAFSYSYGEFQDPLNIAWTGTAGHNSAHTDTWTSSQTFLEGGDTYSRNANYNHNRNIQLQSNARIDISPKGFVGHGNADISYNKKDGFGSSQAATFDADPNEYSDILNDLFVHPDRYRAFTLNRSQTENESRSSGINALANFNGNLKLLADMVNLTARTSYSHTRSNQFALSVYDYLKNGETRDLRNNYTNAPNTNFAADASASYNYGLGRHSVGLAYHYSYQFNKTNNLLYRLDKLDNRDSARFNMLPSAADELARVLDNPNSYIYSQYNNSHNGELTFRLCPKFLNEGGITLELPLEVSHQKLAYHRVTDTFLSQTNTFLNPNLHIEYSSTAKRIITSSQTTIGINLSMNTTAPDLTSRIDYRDDSNPLFVTLGNPNLKNSHTYHASLFTAVFQSKKQRHANASVSYSQNDNARASSVVYDRESGITTSQPTNINGNWNTSANINYGQAIDKNSRLQLEVSMNGSYNNSVDLTQVAGGESAGTNAKSTVHNSSIGTDISMNYMPKSIDTSKFNPFNGFFSAFFSGSLNNTTSRRQGFNAIHAADFRYGASVMFTLPLSIQLNTAITNYCHRGYSDSQMNRDEVVWNATLSRTIPKANLTISAEGFDILGQLSNRRFTVNEQGRTETYTNVTPRYFMLKLTYRFNKFPKNKKNNGMPFISMPPVFIP